MVLWIAATATAAAGVFHTVSFKISPYSGTSLHSTELPSSASKRLQQPTALAETARSIATATDFQIYEFPHLPSGYGGILWFVNPMAFLSFSTNMSMGILFRRVFE